MAQITLNSSGVASNGALVLQSNGTTTAVTINTSQGVEFNAGTAAAPSITKTGDTNTGIFFPAADTIAFAEGGVEAMRLDSSGNLGLGVTPSAWVTTAAIEAFQVSSRAALWGDTTQTVLSNNMYASSTGDKYIESGFSSLYTQISGQHQWFNAPSGTAGNTISFTQAMTLDASGNLGIGTSSPSQKFAVSSSATDVTSINIVNTSSGGGNFNIGAVGSAGWVGGSAGSLVIRDSAVGATRVVLDSSGNVGINNTGNASYKLYITTSAAAQSAIGTTGTSGDAAFQAILITKFDNNSTTSQNFIQFQINNGGANSGKITADGANAATFTSTSDKRVKENIVDLPSQLQNICALRPVEFDYIESEGGGHQIGFIAQDMQGIYQDVVSEQENGMLQISGWSKTEARLVKAIQELKALVDTQASTITALQADVAALKNPT